MADFNQAVGLTDDPSDAVNKGIDAQTSAEMQKIQLAREQFDYQKSLQDPFFKSSLPAYYSLVGAITGEPQSYVDPNYTQLTKNDIAEDLFQKIQSGEIENTNDIWGDPGENKQDALNKIITDPRFKTQFTQPQYRAPDGTITGTAPMIQAKAFNPTESEAYKWQQQQMEKNTGRTLRGLGRENSTYGMNVMADSYRNLASAEYDKQLGRLADLTNIARGGASSLASASAGYNNAAGGSFTNMGTAAANGALANGQLAQNSLYNNQNTMGSLANLGLKIANQWNQPQSTSSYNSDWGSNSGLSQSELNQGYFTTSSGEQVSTDF